MKPEVTRGFWFWRTKKTSQQSLDSFNFCQWLRNLFVSFFLFFSKTQHCNLREKKKMDREKVLKRRIKQIKKETNSVSTICLKERENLEEGTKTEQERACVKETKTEWVGETLKEEGRYICLPIKIRVLLVFWISGLSCKVEQKWILTVRNVHNKSTQTKTAAAGGGTAFHKFT